jgi:sec-independent protein translocase protein TatB
MMFGISGTELMVILVLSLVLVGPEKLPVYAKKFGTLVRNARDYMTHLRTDLDAGLETTVQQTGLSETRKQLEDIRDDVQHIANGEHDQ